MKQIVADSDEVERKNPVYGSSALYPRKTVKKSRNYTELEPTITSASAAPTNINKSLTESDGDPYEDVGNVEKLKLVSKPVPKPKPKPSVGAKPSSPAPGAPPTFQVQHQGAVEEPYTMVSLTNRGKRQAPTPERVQDEEFLPDPGTRPDVPVKQFDDGDVGRGSDISEQPYGNFPSVSATVNDDDGKSFNNGGFDAGDENVYANSGSVGVPSEPDRDGERAASYSNNSTVTSDADGDDVGRYRSQDGLVYTTLEFATGGGQTGGRRAPCDDIDYYATEYASIQVEESKMGNR
ncbi:hypothetical protein EGW08_019484 [Elysia chlorotica]|uniref:Uncharacterized protein n=1 Tax=Elysia chlorotica TaxID=188477 RepID=A0A433SU27_ELYCH|nr:hypothetical protein EGW08_019484 [Elysia chlorotica]